MKKFFDLSLVLLIPVLLMVSYSDSEKTTDATMEISVEAITAYTVIAENSDIEMSAEEIQTIMNTESLVNDPCPGLNEGDCYTDYYLRKFLAYFGCCDDACSIAICFDSNDDGCLTAIDLTAVLANYCE